uniref:TSA: Wollemia nobilis Ref_Wollemi_Transcript_14350_1029 transcribed RNA sequence n=1 Tax=Wollemia nobilis TaxID=56998 RepID=A0A0C9RSY5_9CONI
MGQKASCNKSIEVCPQGIRIVHLNGQVDDVQAPVKVKQVLQQHPRHFLCNSRDLHGIASKRLMSGEDEVRMGEIYFLLPLSILDSEMSPKNSAALAARLLAAAKREDSKPAQGRAGDSNPFRGISSNRTMYEKVMECCDNQELQLAYKEHLMAKSRSWKPQLLTIQEAGLAR